MNTGLIKIAVSRIKGNLINKVLKKMRGADGKILEVVTEGGKAQEYPVLRKLRNAFESVRQSRKIRSMPLRERVAVMSGGKVGDVASNEQIRAIVKKKKAGKLLGAERRAILEKGESAAEGISERVGLTRKIRKSSGKNKDLQWKQLAGERGGDAVRDHVVNSIIVEKPRMAFRGFKGPKGKSSYSSTKAHASPDMRVAAGYGIGGYGKNSGRMSKAKIRSDQGFREDFGVERGLKLVPFDDIAKEHGGQIPKRFLYETMVPIKNLSEPILTKINPNGVVFGADIPKTGKWNSISKNMDKLVDVTKGDPMKVKK